MIILKFFTAQSVTNDTMSHLYVLYRNIFFYFFHSTLYIYKNFFTCKYICDIVTFVTLVYFLYNYAKISQNPGKSALMIMVNVTVIIFFGKSEKNIWVLDFFNYNHWYRISKTD